MTELNRYNRRDFFGRAVPNPTNQQVERLTDENLEDYGRALSRQLTNERKPNNKRLTALLKAISRFEKVADKRDIRFDDEDLW